MRPLVHRQHLITATVSVALLAMALPVSAQWRLPLPETSQESPHPAVARIIVPEEGGTAYGSGTLIDLRDDYGLVLTNWHVVRSATGPIHVQFPSGFVSQARSLKVDSEWDLAALVIWRPECEPVALATLPPRPGDRLTICGYGQGEYRTQTGHCTKFYAPRLDLPRELVELDVQARQGDSGGPIFNDRGELAGVLFGAGEGTTLGSFEGRVKTFLASLAPDRGRAPASGRSQATRQLAQADFPTASSPIASPLASPLQSATGVGSQVALLPDRPLAGANALTSSPPESLLLPETDRPSRYKMPVAAHQRDSFSTASAASTAATLSTEASRSASADSWHEPTSPTPWPAWREDWVATSTTGHSRDEPTQELRGPSDKETASETAPSTPVESATAQASEATSALPLARSAVHQWFDQGKNFLAIVGLIAIGLQLLHLAR